jgi:hypothetical protein
MQEVSQTMLSKYMNDIRVKRSQLYKDDQLSQRLLIRGVVPTNQQYPTVSGINDM